MNVERELFGKRKVSGKSGRGRKRAIRGKLDCSVLYTCAKESQGKPLLCVTSTC